MDLQKLVFSNDKSIIDRMEEEGEPIPVLSYEEYLNLPTTDEYKNNEERKKRIEKEKEEQERRNEQELVESKYISKIYDGYK